MHCSDNVISWLCRRFLRSPWECNTTPPTHACGTPVKLHELKYLKGHIIDLQPVLWYKRHSSPLGNHHHAWRNKKWFSFRTCYRVFIYFFLFTYYVLSGLHVARLNQLGIFIFIKSQAKLFGFAFCYWVKSVYTSIKKMRVLKSFVENKAPYITWNRGKRK